jgi:hypothetical protein
MKLNDDFLVRWREYFGGAVTAGQGVFTDRTGEEMRYPLAAQFKKRKEQFRESRFPGNGSSQSIHHEKKHISRECN